MIPERYATDEKTVPLAVCTMGVVNGDEQADLAKIEANLREAATQGIDLVAFPEEALVGGAESAACRASGPPCAPHPQPNSRLIAEEFAKLASQG